VQGVQNETCEIETYDENALGLLQESVFYGTIQIVPVTLPEPIPKMLSADFFEEGCGSCFGERIHN